MESQVKKVKTLLSVFQASLFTHIKSVASNRSESTSYLGYVPSFQIVEHSIEESVKSNEIQEQSVEEPLMEEPSEEVFEISIIPIKLHKHGKVLKKKTTLKNDLAGFLERSNGEKKHPIIVKNIEIEFEETGKIETKSKYSTTPKVLQRLMSSDIKPKPARFIVPEDTREESTQASLYGEVIATTYSQGGDGFALHPGDFVSVLQFLNEFGLVECKWQGLKGLFPQDKIKLITRPSQSLNSSISSLISKQFINTRPITNESINMSKSSKVMNRLLKKNFE